MHRKYKEFHLVDLEGTEITVYRPIVEITFSKKDTLSKPSGALLDSGADMILFPISIARYFEVSLMKKWMLPVLLADGKIGEIYKLPYEFHKISIFCDGKEIKETIFFSEGQETPLLGQDFFKHFKITFDRKKKTFDLKKNL